MKKIVLPLSVLIFLIPLLSFSQQEMTAREENYKSGFIDKTGKIVIEPQFEDAMDFSEGLAMILK